MRHTCSTCGYCKSGVLLSEVSNGREDPCETCEVITVNEFTNWRPIPITNADRIRAMTDYDLADWIANILMCHGAFARSEDFDFDRYCADCPLDKCCNDQSSDNIEGWLKSPADEVSE